MFGCFLFFFLFVLLSLFSYPPYHVGTPAVACVYRSSWLLIWTSVVVPFNYLHMVRSALPPKRSLFFLLSFPFPCYERSPVDSCHCRRRPITTTTTATTTAGWWFSWAASLKTNLSEVKDTYKYTSHIYTLHIRSSSARRTGDRKPLGLRYVGFYCYQCVALGRRLVEVK